MAVPTTAPAARVHGLPVKIHEPAGITLNVTVPVGVVGVAELSVTVAVQDEAAPTTREEGAQETVVVVEELVEATVDPRLGEFTASVLRKNTEETPTARMRNASTTGILLKLRPDEERK